MDVFTGYFRGRDISLHVIDKLEYFNFMYIIHYRAGENELPDYPIERIVDNFQKTYNRTGGDGSITAAGVRRFRTIIYNYYKTYKRDFPWRRTTNPYYILVSEIMLQQTQTERVMVKYREFIKRFPTLRSLASAELRDVLSSWQGLGYNRRGKMLHQLAQDVLTHHRGKIPESPEELVNLPGIGKATAGSFAAFAFDRPVVFIETNIRTVFIHFFFSSRKSVTDTMLIPLVEKTLDKKRPGLWYSALMDYGVMIKKNCPNPSRKSAHHQRQSKFEGSHRQIRGHILKTLLEEGALSHEKINLLISGDNERIDRALGDLVKEGLVSLKGKLYRI